MAGERIQMRKQARQMRSEEDVDALLREAPVGHLGTCYGNEPYVVPLNYVFLDGKVYFHSVAGVGKKTRNLRENAAVCFEVAEMIGVTADPGARACEFGVNYRSVVIYGTARQVEDPAARRRALEGLMQKYAAGRPYEPMTDADISTVAVWEIDVEEKAGKRCPNP